MSTVAGVNKQHKRKQKDELFCRSHLHLHMNAEHVSTSVNEQGGSCVI